MNRDTLHVLARHWRQTLFARDLLFALAVANLGTILAILFPSASWLGWLNVVAFAGTLTILLAANRPWRIDAARVAGHLDRTYPEMEESGALFLKPPEHLTLPERWQLRRVE